RKTNLSHSLNGMGRTGTWPGERLRRAYPTIRAVFIFTRPRDRSPVFSLRSPVLRRRRGYAPSLSLLRSHRPEPPAGQGGPGDVAGFLQPLRNHPLRGDRRRAVGGVTGPGPG